jgi:uncharacterized protein
MDSPTLAHLDALQTQVLALGFVLAVALGGLLQRSHFCTMGAISDWVLMQDATRLRQWALALVVAALGMGAMSWAGAVSPLDSLYAVPRFPWLSFLLGGWLFGVGMVLASGCPVKNLVRLGGGNLKSLVVLLVTALAALSMLRGTAGVWRVRWLAPWSAGPESGPFMGQWLAAQTGLGLSQAFLAAALLVSVCLLAWIVRDRSFFRAGHAWAAVGVGGILLLLWWASGVWALVPEHPETLERVHLATASGRMEGLNFTAPLAQWLDAGLYQADGGKRLTLGMLLVPGVVLGAAGAAHAQGAFRWEGFTRTSDLARHLVGGLLMGWGGVSAMGCSFGQGLTGLSTLSWGSMLAAAAMVGGAWSALRVQWWLAERQGLS